MDYKYGSGNNVNLYNSNPAFSDGKYKRNWKNVPLDSHWGEMESKSSRKLQIRTDSLSELNCFLNVVRSEAFSQLC